MASNALVIRIKPGQEDLTGEFLATGDVIVGWAGKSDLREINDRKELRKTLAEQYYGDREDMRAAGRAAGMLWRFLHELHAGDYVLVPHGGSFHIARVTDGTVRRVKHPDTGTTYFRLGSEILVENVPRGKAPAAVQSRLKGRGTVTDASDLVESIQHILSEQEHGVERSLTDDLYEDLRGAMLRQIQEGKMNDRAFEGLVASLLSAMGCRDVRIIPRQQDQGVDIVATYNVGPTALRLGVQAKWFDPERGEIGTDIVEILIEGMQAEDADVGWIVTTGSFSEDAAKLRDCLVEDGQKIEFVDGPMLFQLILEVGINKVFKALES